MWPPGYPVPYPPLSTPPLTTYFLVEERVGRGSLLCVGGQLPQPEEVAIAAVCGDRVLNNTDVRLPGHLWVQEWSARASAEEIAHACGALVGCDRPSALPPGPRHWRHDLS